MCRQTTDSGLQPMMLRHFTLDWFWMRFTVTKWFMETQCDFKNQLRDFSLVLALGHTTTCLVMRLAPIYFIKSLARRCEPSLQWCTQSSIWFESRLTSSIDSKAVSVSTQDSLTTDFVHTSGTDLTKISSSKCLHQNSTVPTHRSRQFGVVFLKLPFSSMYQVKFQVVLSTTQQIQIFLQKCRIFLPTVLGI